MSFAVRAKGSIPKNISIPNTNIALLELFQGENQYIVVGD
jgi:hypothetical protein